MNSLNFNEGYKTFVINDDPNRVIRFTPTDFNIISRINKAVQAIDDYKKSAPDVELNADGSPADGLAESAQAVDELDRKIREQIDFIFNSPVSDVVFGNQSPRTPTGGVPLYERFIMAVIPEIEAAVKEEKKAMQKRINKYASQKVVKR